MLEKYSDVSKKIKEIDISLKYKILYSLCAGLISLLIVSGPLCILINLMVFRDIQKLLAFGIATIIIVFITLTNYFYIKMITQGEVKNIRIVILTETFILAILIYLILILIYFLGVI